MTVRSTALSSTKAKRTSLLVRFASDSPLEGDGFELPVPGRETVKPVMGDGAAVSKTGPDLLRNLRFESISLQRRVCEPPVPLQGLCGPRHCVENAPVLVAGLPALEFGMP